MYTKSEVSTIKAVQITSRFPSVHGVPVYVGNPQTIGITDISKPDFDGSVTIKEGEVSVFLAYGVYSQAIVMKVKPEIMIAHAPGHMFITDLKNEKISI